VSDVHEPAKRLQPGSSKATQISTCYSDSITASKGCYTKQINPVPD